MSRRASAPSRPVGGDDAGVTLIELTVAMVLMSIFLAMFSAGVASMYRALNKTESTTTAQSQMNIAFLRLDREIRYAADISAPGTVAGNPYVEFLVTNTGTPTCTELRLDVAAKQLQRRSWPQGATPLSPTAWRPLATGVSSTQPFTRSAADATYNFQRLELRLLASAGSGATATTKQTAVTFTALNTSLVSSTGTVCTEGRSVA